MTTDDQTSAFLTTAAERLGAEHGREALLDRVVRLSLSAAPAVDHASITLKDGNGFVTPAASGALAREIDALQYELDEGPCVEATRSGSAFVVLDVAAEPRWPRFASEVARRQVQAAQVRSMLALPLRAGSSVTGSLNLSSSTAHAFAAPVADTAAVFAAMVELALAATVERDKAAANRSLMDSFVDGLAHDLRSGMTVLLLARELLADRRHLLDAHGREALDLLDEELTRQRGLLEDLLGLARTRTGHPSAKPVPLAPLVQEALRHHRRHVPLRLAPGTRTAHVALHPVQGKRILLNLLDNADRHAGGATAVIVGCDGEHGWVAVEDSGPGVPLWRHAGGAPAVMVGCAGEPGWGAVEDSGPGVPPWRHDGIFTRFAASSLTGQHLGLALCREHARTVGGDLVIEDRDEGGARFRLILPLVDHGPREAPAD